MTDDELREAILDAAKDDPARFVRLLREYYGDAERTSSRELLLLHLGLCTGVLGRVVVDHDPEVRQLLTDFTSLPPDERKSLLLMLRTQLRAVRLRGPR